MFWTQLTILSIVVILLVLSLYGAILPNHNLDQNITPDYVEVVVGRNKVMIEVDNMTLIRSSKEGGIIKFVQCYNYFGKPLHKFIETSPQPIETQPKNEKELTNSTFLSSDNSNGVYFDNFSAIDNKK